ncbi:hypothetical protein [Streptomyces sp. NBC_00525]|uniref:hypothetical protein n=1 Tax=Streptomyces sp. NBC_00525 TaxID=2903660 RepID=UPI003FCDD7E9
MDRSAARQAPRQDAHLARLDPRLGPLLAALPCELVWATTWEDEANIDLAPRLGLPPLPVVHWPEPSNAHEREDQWFGLHWKTRTLLRLARWSPGRMVGRLRRSTARPTAALRAVVAPELAT